MTTRQRTLEDGKIRGRYPLPTTHQGTKLILWYFIGFAQPLNLLGRHHDLFMANMLTQAKALAFLGISRPSAAHSNYTQLKIYVIPLVRNQLGGMHICPECELK